MQRTPTDAWLDEVVVAVRSDEKIGRGSCSTVDECLEDGELRTEVTRLFGEGQTTPKKVVAWLRKIERIRNGIAEDIRNA